MRLETVGALREPYYENPVCCYNSTCLRYSLDECKTWSEEIVVDKLLGAYPSMVDLKDGSVLVVYYEEGLGSSIRARRFRATPTASNGFRVEQ